MLRRRRRPEPAGATKVHGTLLGTLGSGAVAEVDGRGLVTPTPSASSRCWSVDWWIGADDRWHLPGRETAVRQVRVGVGPVVETAMRVPGGDAVHRCAAVPAAGGDGAVVIVEVENRSPTPFALAVALRPPAVTIELDGAVVSVDGVPALRLSGTPRPVAGATAASGDALDVVVGGRASDRFPAPLSCPQRGATAAFLLPVAHRGMVRYAVMVEGAPAPRPWPDLANVARSWSTVGRRGLRVDLPEPRLQEAVEACRRSVLLAELDDPGLVDIVPTLDEWGLHSEADEILRSVWATERTDGSFTDGSTVAALAALRRHVDLAGDRSLLDDLDPGAVELAAAAATAGGHGRSGALPVEGRTLDEWLASASPTWSWPNGVRGAAGLLAAVRAALVGPDDRTVVPVLRPGWAGRSFEVHDAPTAWGPLSFAVRWHGRRPALLWELVPGAREQDHRDVHKDEPRVSWSLAAPGLDPSWSATEPSGESLLSGRPA